MSETITSAEKMCTELRGYLANWCRKFERNVTHNERADAKGTKASKICYWRAKRSKMKSGAFENLKVIPEKRDVSTTRDESRKKCIPSSRFFMCKLCREILRKC